MKTYKRIRGTTAQQNIRDFLAYRLGLTKKKVNYKFKYMEKTYHIYNDKLFINGKEEGVKSLEEINVVNKKALQENDEAKDWLKIIILW